MATVEDSLCPVCRCFGTLRIERGFRTASVGTYSLAGAQLKVAAVEAPRLCCSECGLDVLGEYESDGRHVSFPSIKPESPDGS